MCHFVNRPYWQLEIDILKIGYVRVSTQEQSTARQEVLMEGLGVDQVYIRPLAKLDQAVKITDTSNQRKAKCETVSAVGIGFREDTEPFNKADSVFNKDTFP